ncbi:UNC-50 [Backusella circina FSU 941]|nr:UNC-50 [Backusella circina FSU 941]
MDILPTSKANTRRVRRGSSVPVLLKRLSKFRQMDFEFALWQMLYLLIAPRRVYRNIYYHKQTKNQWARDDPAFLVLLASLLCISAIAWGLAFGLGVVGILRAMLFMVIVDFVLVGSIVATCTWFLTNRYLRVNTNQAGDQQVEWAYAFDIHCNSFFPLFLMLYILQFFIFPIITRHNIVSLAVGNFIYFVSIVWYIHGTFLGFNALPFLARTEVLLYPIGVFAILFVASLFGINISETVIGFYFGWE